MGYRNYIGSVPNPADGAAPGIYSVLDVYQDILQSRWPASPVLPTAPTSVVATPSFRQIAVAWSAPLTLDGQTVTGYKVAIATVNGSPTVINTAGTSHTFTNLTNDTVYSIRVAAVTSSGTGAYSAGAIATPFASLAAAPTAVTAVATGRSVALSWTAGTPGTTATSDYLVQYSTDGAITWIDTDDGTSSATSASFINLVPDQTYVFRVAGVNAQGTGPYSAASNAVTIVVPIITITEQPTSQESFAFAATFSTNATVTAGGTLSYQWYLVGAESSTAISGATSRTLSLTGLTGEDNGKLYQCLVSTTGGGDTVATDTASLSVPTPVITIDTEPTDQTASGRAATFTVAASVTLGATLSYQWQRGISGSYTNVAGANSATLSLTGLTHIGNNGQTYLCRVSATGGAATVDSSAATLTVPAPVVTISAQPTDQTATARAASFSVSATVTEGATLSYQWQTPVSGTFADIAGATSATLSLSSLLYTVNDQQLYRCVVSATDGASSVVTGTATLTVPAPVITLTSQPTAQTSSNQTATYSVTATVTNDATLSYQWQRQAGAAYSNLAGKTSATLSLTGLTNTDNNGDYYRCVVSATDGATPVNTDGAALTVPVPSITIGTQPTAQTASGGTASFTVAATITNGATLSYQWQRQALGAGNYSSVSGATSPTLSLTGLTNLGNDQDSYRCVVSGTDNASSVTSSAAILTAPAPVITIDTQPTAQTSSNQTATFSVVASVTAGATLSYQWQRQALGTGGYAAISGQTSATLSLTGLTNTANNADNYRCVVSATDGATNVTSTAAALTVPVPVISITAQPEAQSTNDTAAYAVYSVSAEVTNGATLSYQWQRQPSGGSFSNISGQTSSTLTLTGLTYAGNNGDNYRCVVSATDNASSVNSSAAGLTITQTPSITITAQPSDQTASSGAATFSVTATITLSATLSYQWQKQSLGTGSYANVSGGTSASLSLTGLTNAANNGDNYRCLVSGSGGAASVTSSSATLAVSSFNVPGAPTGLSGTAGDAQVALSWSAPSSNGGAAITGYVVEWTPAGGSASTVNTGSATTSYTKTALTNSTAHTFRVAAINSVGTGPFSASASATPVAAGPTISYLVVGGGGGGQKGGGGGGQVVEGTMAASGPLRLRVGLGGSGSLLNSSGVDYFFILPSKDRRGGTPSILGSITAAGGAFGGTNPYVGGAGNGGATSQSNGAGGSGVVSTLTGLRYGGGGSGVQDDGDGGWNNIAGGAGGGGGTPYGSGTNGLGGGGGGDASYGNGGGGGNGVVVLQLAAAPYYISPSLTYTVAGNRYTFTAGDGYVTVAQPAPLAVQIPRMTSNTAPSGSVLRFGALTGARTNDAYQYFGTAADGGGFYDQVKLAVNAGVGYDFGATNTFTGYYAIPYYGDSAVGGGPSALEFSGSNDGINWTVLNTASFNLSPDSNANSWWQGRDNDGWQWDSSRRNEFTAAGSYRFVRWMNTGNVATALAKLQLLLPASPALVPSPPGAPTALSGASATGEIALSWTAPINNGTSALTGYVVEFTPAGGSASTVSTGSTATSYAVSGLTNGTAHTFRVAGVSSAGQGPYSSAITITPAPRLVTLLRGPQASGAAQWGFQHLTGSGTAADPFIVQSGTNDVINFNPVWFISGTATMNVQVPTRMWDDDGYDRPTSVRLRSGSTLSGISSSRTAGTNILTATAGTYSVPVTNSFVRYTRIDNDEYPGEWTGLRIWFTGTTVDTSPLPAGTLLSGAGWTGQGRSSSRLTLSANRGEPWSMPVTAAASGICVARLLSEDSYNDGNYAKIFVNGVLVLNGNGTTGGSFPVISGQVITFTGDVGGVSILQGTTLYLI